MVDIHFIMLHIDLDHVYDKLDVKCNLYAISDAELVSDWIYVHSNVKTLSISDMYFEYPYKFILSNNITKLKLCNIFELFRINFTGNNNLQIIKIQVGYFSRSIYDKQYSGDNIDLSHLYNLQKIYCKCYTKDSHELEFEQNINKIMEKVKLPYGCSIVCKYK